MLAGVITCEFCFCLFSNETKLVIQQLGECSQTQSPPPTPSPSFPLPTFLINKFDELKDFFLKEKVAPFNLNRMNLVLCFVLVEYFRIQKASQNVKTLGLPFLRGIVIDLHGE